MGAVPFKRPGKPNCDSPCRVPRACTVVTAVSGSERAGETLSDHQGLRAVETGMNGCRGIPTAPEDGNCLLVLPGRLLAADPALSEVPRRVKDSQNRPRAPRHHSLLGIGSPNVDKAVDSGLKEERMLSEYQELSLLSVVSGTSQPICQLTWKDGIGGK